MYGIPYVALMISAGRLHWAAAHAASVMPPDMVSTTDIDATHLELKSHCMFLVSAI